MPVERVGVFGGTFDPIHVGHVVAAVEARRALALDRLLMVVAGDPWQKRGQVVARAADRLAMVEAAVAGGEGLGGCDIGGCRPRPSYTAGTPGGPPPPGRGPFPILGGGRGAPLGTSDGV